MRGFVRCWEQAMADPAPLLGHPVWTDTSMLLMSVLNRAEEEAGNRTFLVEMQVRCRQRVATTSSCEDECGLE